MAGGRPAPGQMPPTQGLPLELGNVPLPDQGDTALVALKRQAALLTHHQTPQTTPI